LHFEITYCTVVAKEGETIMSKTTTRTSEKRARWALPAAVLLGLLCIAQFLDAMDISSMGVILPIIQQDLGMSPQYLQWIISGYVLGFGGFLLLGGRVADLFGRRRVFLISVVLFALASLAGGFAQEGWQVIASRIFKGIFAGFTAPAALSLLLGLYQDPKERNRALGIFSAMGAAGFVLGVVIGGLLGDISWRLAFFLPVPIALVVAVLVALGLPADAKNASTKQFDLIGAITGTAALLFIVFGATQAATYGWLSISTFGPLLLGIVLFLAFLAYERRAKAPLMPLTIFRQRGLGFASAMAFFMQGNYAAYQFVVALFFQSKLGWSASQTVLVFVFSGVIVAVLAPRFAKLAHRIGAEKVLLLGMVLEMLGVVWFLLAHTMLDPVILMGVAQVLIGGGIAAALPGFNIAGLTYAKEKDHGLASGIVLSSLQIGGGVIVAIAASIFAISGEHAYTNSLWIITLFGIAASVIAALQVRKARRLAVVPALVNE
jgi:MFS family permease